jgi:hypothetical protein
MRPAHLPFEVKFKNASGWVGLGHLFGTQEYVQSRWRAAFPFLASTVVQSFPGANALTPVNNQNPVFYVQASEIGTLYSMLNPDSIRLLRLRTRDDHREIPVSKGITTFTFTPGVPRQFVIPATLERLSATLIELKPRAPLSPGQYLITMGPQEKDGFEFEITCGR